MTPSQPESEQVDPRVRHIDYRCTRCGEPTARDHLTVKRVAFVTMGARSKNLRQRSVAWLCRRCLEADPEWNLPPRATAPGMSDTRIAD